MAGRYKYNTAPYVATAFSATSEAAGFPKERLTSLLRINRPWRSTSTAQQLIVIDLGSSKSMGAILLHRCNFTSVSLGHDNTSGGPFASISGSPFAVAQDLKDGGVYKRIVEPVGITNRYLQVTIPNQATTDGAAFFQMGAVLVMGAMTATVANPQNPTDEERLQHSIRAGIGADEEVVEVGLPQLQERWQLRLDTQAEVNEWRTLRNLGEASPVVWWYNNQTHDAYVMRHVGGITIRDSDHISEVSATWRQVR